MLRSRCLAQSWSRPPNKDPRLLVGMRDPTATQTCRLPRWMRHTRVYTSGSYRGRQSPPPQPSSPRNSERVVSVTALCDHRIPHSISSTSQGSFSHPDTPRPLPTHKLLVPLPRFDPFVRMRSESLSSIVDVPHLLLSSSTEVALGPAFPRLRKSRTTGSMKQGFSDNFGHVAPRTTRGHRDLRRHQSGGLAFQTVF